MQGSILSTAKMPIGPLTGVSVDQKQGLIAVCSPEEEDIHILD